MSTTTAPAPQGAAPAVVVLPVSRKAAVGLSVLALVALVLFGFLAGTKSASFGLVDTGREASALAAWLALAVTLIASAWFGYLWFRARRAGHAPARWVPGTLAAAVVVFLLSVLGVAGVTVITLSAPLLGWLTALVMLAIAAYSVWLTIRRRRTPRWATAVFAVAFLVGFLVWIVAGGRDQTPYISLAGLLAGAVTLSVPLVFGSLSGVLCERSGIVNIAIEGQLLMGAFSAAVGATIAHNVYVGLASAAIAGALVSLVLALVSIKYLVNQIIVGVVLNVLVVGLTNFLFSTLLTEDPDGLNKPPHLGSIEIPILADVPVIGPILFRQSLVGYLMYAAVIVVYVGLFHTRWGLRVRAVGEHPQAADTLGVNVNRTRFWNTILGGAVAGIGGSFFTLVAVDAFSKEMSAGRGYIALAALIFGRWNPIGAFLASLLFGFADNLQSIITIIGSPVPSQFMAMLPYVVTVFAVAGLVGRSRPPAMEGIPYVKQ
ncbi:ABC transporter permease [Sinomonas sp. ASV486]|uniref:ABC transporter permease n=1 Tax=Sinomonas sp. ASV486 TaxID=3051170 RepID=UPI0027DB6EDE|nr:ABC transporter permease [Sinomonas sp. ASV486]MDQ4490258.1 ABC transporter permease [Sinomonas sp. ASV486]